MKFSKHPKKCLLAFRNVKYCKLSVKVGFMVSLQLRGNFQRHGIFYLVHKKFLVNYVNDGKVLEP